MYHGMSFHTTEMSKVDSATTLQLLFHVRARNIRLTSLGKSCVLKPLNRKGADFLYRYRGLVLDVVQVNEFQVA